MTSSTPHDSRGLTPSPLFEYVKKDLESSVAGAIEEQTDPNQVDIFGNTPLFYVQSSEIATRLLRANTLPLLRNNSGNTPLLETALAGNQVSLKALLGAGVDPYKKKYHVNWWLQYSELDTLLAPTSDDAKRSMVDQKRILTNLKDAGFSFNRLSEGWSKSLPPLFRAHRLNAEQIATLIQLEANPYLEDKKNHTPLNHLRDSETAKAFLNAGVDFDKPNTKGQTPIQVALTNPYHDNPKNNKVHINALLSADVRINLATVKLGLFSGDLDIAKVLVKVHFRQNQATYVYSACTLIALSSLALRAHDCATREEAPQDDSFLGSFFGSPTPPPQTFGECVLYYGKV